MSDIYKIIFDLLPFTTSGGHDMLHQTISDYAKYQEVIDIEGRTEIMVSLYTKDDKAVKLINMGCNIFLKDIYKNSLIHFCKSVEVLKIILEMGVNIDEKNKYGNTLLHATEHCNITEFLITNKADINAINKYEYTPLMFCCTNDECLPFAELLIKSGADLNHIDNNKGTAIKTACYNDSIKITRLLIDSGVKYDKNELLIICHENRICYKYIESLPN